MKKQIMLLLSTVLVAGAANAKCGSDDCAMSLVSSVVTSFSPFFTSGSLFAHKQIIENAKPDAEVFLASNGEVYGAYLAQAIELARTLNPDAAVATDMELAQAILAF